MMADFLTQDTKATLLLRSVFGDTGPYKPLRLNEYSSLVRWLVHMKMSIGDLLQNDLLYEVSVGSGIDQQRLEALFGQVGHLELAMEQWQRDGIWVISRSNFEYPGYFTRRLGDSSPGILFCVGNRSLLKSGGLGIVGSRNVNQEGEAFAREVAQICASHGMAVVSGFARGVDQAAMGAAIDAGGVAIGILPDNLRKKSSRGKARQAIADGHLLLMSPYNPNADFSAGAAMGRNRLIYALSDYGLVVAAEHKKGGTWTGAEGELRRKNPVPVFVRTGSDVPLGNHKLLEIGAIPWPELIDHQNFRKQLHDLAVNGQKSLPI